ncbi:MAG: pyridoxal-phosphate dependent enzyme [Anaerolineae bacterium]|jgi:cysteine synthase|nr:pyridoxal-phosphate dependent enzyme [Anaerolineae bacterium]MDH7473807.1 pyridoxal-phosphate dependent enzyme [Anaerolineae bacterium]
MSKKYANLITGPTFEEMLHPEKIDPAVRQRALRMKNEDPLDPINLYNITWKDADNRIRYYVLPPQLTGVEAPIAVLYGKDFPTGSHKVGATYSVLIEKELTGEVDPTIHSLVWPSTGNYGIGGAWVGCRMKFDSIVILPEEMSRERFDLVRSYGARLILTPGCESNVKEIYDKCAELRAQDPERIRILNQFEVFGNYRFHYYVTGNTCIELAAELKEKGIGNGKVAAYVSAMGSAGTIAAGDRLKQAWPEHKIVGLEPIQCPTIYWNGYGGHDIQGIGDKHVTWIHNVMNMDAIMCIDDIECKMGLQLLTEEAGWKTMIERYGVPEESVRLMAETFGISGVCNVLGAIKTAKWYGFGKNDLIVTILTDAIDRYHSVMKQMTATYGPMDEVEAAVRLVSIFHKQKLDWISEGTREARNRWHNLKYYTWVEQQGKTVEELNAQRHQDYWEAQQARVAEIDRLIHEYRGQS